MPDLPMKSVSRILLHPTTYFVLGMILFLSHAALYANWLGFEAVDDAYISFRYAYNAARGHGLTFNMGEQPVEGYTNFLWTVMMIPCFWLNLPVYPTSLLLGLLWALGSILLLRRVSTSASPMQAEYWLSPVAALLLASDGSFALWTVGGLESPLFAFLVLVGGLAYLREMQSPGALPVSGVWFALAAMTRPEGVLIYGLTGLHQVVTRLGRERRVITGQDWQRLALFLLIWLPWFALRWQYYGFPWPNTFYAKVDLADTALQYQRGLAHIQTFIHVHMGYWPLFIALLPLLYRRWWRWSSYFTLIILVYGTYIVYIGGDWSVGRFFVPLLPLFYTLLAGGLIVAKQGVEQWLSQWPDLRPIRILMATVVVVGLGLGFFTHSSLNGEKSRFIDTFQTPLASRARITMGRWLHDNMPRNTYIAVDAAGQIPFYSDLKTIDLYGLTNLTISHRKRNIESNLAGHDKTDMDYLLSVVQPDYIIVYGNFFDWLQWFGYDRIYLAWTNEPELYPFLSVYGKQAPRLTKNPLPTSTPTPSVDSNSQPDIVQQETSNVVQEETKLDTSSPANSPDTDYPTIIPLIPRRSLDENPLTGLKVDDPALLQRRPLMVRVGNDPGARPQVGLNQADIVYEEIVEWWVTRFTAIYLSQDPEMIAPIRSARLINVQLIPQYQGVLANSGGSDPVRWELSQSGMINLDEYFVPQPYFYRENEGWQTRLAFDATAAREYLQDKGLERAVGLRGFVFSEKLDMSIFPKEVSGEAKEIIIPYPQQTSQATWQYDQDNGTYLRFITGEPLLDFDGNQIAAMNVIIYFAEHQGTDIIEDSNGATSIRINVNGLNTAWLLRDGQILKGKWQTNGYEMPEFIFNDGRPMPLKPGNTWIEVAPFEYLIEIDGVSHTRLNNSKDE